MALALAPLAVEASGEHAFVTQFLAHWGSAHGAKRERSTRGAKKRRRLRPTLEPPSRRTAKNKVQEAPALCTSSAVLITTREALPGT